MKKLLLAALGLVLLGGTFGLHGQEAGERMLIEELSGHPYLLLPVLPADGSVCYLTFKHHEFNTGGTNDMDDAWYAVRNPDGSWAEPRNIGAPLNTFTSDVIFSVSADGKTALVSGNYAKRSFIKPEGLSFSRRLADGWTKPEVIYIRQYKNNGRNYMASLSLDGRTLILSLMGDNTEGELDLYVSHRSAVHDNVWEPPQHLGSVINTEEFESHPHLAADGKTLYFSSTREGGYGYADIYMSRRLDDTWQNWSEPVNLGERFNNEGEDGSIWLSAPGDSAYFISSTDLNSGIGVYFAELPQQFRPEPYALCSGKLSNSDLEPTMDAMVKAYAVSDTGAPIPAANSFSSLPDGTYGFTLTRGREYLIEASSPGYPAVYTSVDLRELNDYRHIEYDFMLERQRNGARPLCSVYFDSKDTTLHPSQARELAKTLIPARNVEGLRIDVVGHADDLGTDRDNLMLSLKRARAVAQGLYEQGIVESMVSVRGLGEREPAQEGLDDSARQANRRVEIVLVYRGDGDRQ